MENAELLKQKSVEELEEWFLAGIGSEAVPVKEMSEILSYRASKGEIDMASTWADMLLDTLVENDDRLNALNVLTLKSEWFKGDDDSRRMTAEWALKIFNDRVGKVLVQSCGFELRKNPVAECLRRLKVLSSMTGGVLVFDKTWGFGVVKRVDDFYKKVTIDFAKKSGHQMSFAYAAETLEILTDEHLYAIRHRDPEGMAKMIAEDPAEVVRITLRSFGSMSVPLLQEKLCGDIIEESGWKGFWDKARKVLKADPMVDVPAKRNDPIVILEKAKAYDSEWFETLKGERDIDIIMGKIADLEKEGDVAGADDAALGAVADRLAFVVKAADGTDPALLGSTLIVIKRLGLEDRISTLDRVVESLFDVKTFLSATVGMPARHMEAFISYLAGRDAERLSGMLLTSLSDMQMNVLNVVIEYLLANGREDGVSSHIGDCFAVRHAVPEVLYWLCRNEQIAGKWPFYNAYDHLVMIITVMDDRHTGDRLRTRNQLRTLIEDKEWFLTTIDKLNSGQREDVFGRVRNSRGWDVSAKRSVLAKMIKRYPELEALMVAASAKEEPEQKMARVTSIRTYRERQEALKKLVNEDIPANSKEIGIARSYGDLRENAEYDAAKQHQAVLMAKQAEWSDMLRTVSSKEFDNTVPDAVGIGSSVKLEKADGQTVVYNILGEWDNDDTLNIISSKSKLAEILDGCKAGDDVVLPSPTGEEQSKVVSVDALPEDVLAWAKGV